MGQTKFQKFIFTLMMCFFMVLGMTTYNIILNEGFHSNLLNNLLKDFWLGFIVALLLYIFGTGTIKGFLAWLYSCTFIRYIYCWKTCQTTSI